MVHMKCVKSANTILRHSQVCVCVYAGIVTITKVIRLIFRFILFCPKQNRKPTPRMATAKKNHPAQKRCIRISETCYYRTTCEGLLRIPYHTMPNHIASMLPIWWVGARARTPNHRANFVGKQIVYDQTVFIQCNNLLDIEEQR